ncbi:MAG: helix-turn-helix domain-containing protein [Actinomyces sp.]|uniref:helix-turn-helix domain-containing protein n=1 Tax=Actinomyces sp. TaxID=29317 RepID=UPI0026DDC258|nr:helix-turn-helix domain-containing protein [Actinomyces sp.]MDO4243565.1 helix-turn-helix domain-containing protein [Actinomyces sp.]
MSGVRDSEMAALARAVQVMSDRLQRMEALLAGGAVEEVRTLSVDEVVRLTGAPRRMVLAAIRTGDLPAVQAGERTKLVRPGDLDAWLERLEERAGHAA